MEVISSSSKLCVVLAAASLGLLSPLHTLLGVPLPSSIFCICFVVLEGVLPGCFETLSCGFLSTPTHWAVEHQQQRAPVRSSPVLSEDGNAHQCYCCQRQEGEKRQRGNSTCLGQVMEEGDPSSAGDAAESDVKLTDSDATFF